MARSTDRTTPHRRRLTAVWLLAGLAATAADGRAAAQNHPGFPKTVVDGGVVRFGKPLVVDLHNNGGAKEIVVGTCVNSSPGDGDCESRKLWVFDNNGNVLAGWPASGVSLPGEPYSGPAAGQLDGDTPLEIVIGTGSGVPGEVSGGVRAFNIDGSQKWFYPTFDVFVDGQPDPVASTPALGDLNGDGLDDVVFGSFDFNAHAVNGSTGAALPGWPIFLRDTTWSSPALADLDGDNTLEVVIGADSHFEGSPINTVNGGVLFVFRANGTNFPGFPQFAPTGAVIVGFQSSPAVGDIDGDGCPEIVIGTGQTNPAEPAGRLLHAWNHNGSVVAGWPVAMDGHPVSSPALGNLDADEALEVVASDDTAQLYAFNGNGSLIFKMRPKAINGANALAVNEPVIAQIGSDNPAILTGGVGFDVTVVSKTGVQISNNGSNGGPTFTTQHPVVTPVVADLDANGGLEIVAASGSTVANEKDLGVWAWLTSGSNLPWPMFGQGPQRRRTAPGTVGCPLVSPPLNFFTLTPCRVADSRQPGNSTYGGPKYVAGEQRTITFHGVCGVPATAKAVSLNVTATEGTTSGLLRVFAAGDGPPPAQVVVWSAGQTRANNAVVSLALNGTGRLTVQNAAAGPVHVVLDINGYFQ